ncbi:MAG: hypothetical protein JWM11_3531 [Planctomycetaceae bacterium]|nr:hypothetical protein [Planctomycetaceae bacterium]
MIMIDTLVLVPAFITGMLLGIMFFGGLWWTVQQGLASSIPAIWFLSSLLLRMGLALAGFYWISQGHWERLGVCLVGFLIARSFVTWFVHSANTGCPGRLEGCHAPQSR